MDTQAGMLVTVPLLSLFEFALLRIDGAGVFWERRFGGLGVAVYSQKIRKPDRSSGFSKHHPTREQW